MMNTLNNDPIAEIAKEVFAIDYLYPIQRYVISNILENKNQIIIFPTGGGKSLCFQLPIYFLDGLTLVVVPLLSLMEDQLRRLGELNIEAAVIKGGQTSKERDDIIRRIKDGKIKIAYITPESLCISHTLEQLKEINIRHLVIDEAHCIYEWGETFRPAYLELAKAINYLDIPLISAFTATASEKVTLKIKEIIFDDNYVRTVIENPDRPNISYSVIPTTSKFHTLSELIKTKEKPVVIFTRSRKRCEQVARILRDRFPEIEVFFYHAGLNKEERKTIEKWFMKTENGILSATTAYGMGIDKRNVRLSIHLDTPMSCEAYLQESGRIGRDQKPAESVLIYSSEDVSFAKNISESVGRSRYKKVLAYAESVNKCRRKHLLSLLSYELKEVCIRCDYCNGSLITKIAGREEIIQFIKKNKRRFTLREVRQILAGEKTYDVITKDLDCIPGYGIISDWNTQDIEESIKNLIDSSEIYIPSSGFWKHRLTLRRK